MARHKTNFIKHGYSHDLKELIENNPMAAMKLFCVRRSQDISKSFEHSLVYRDLIARIYYQGLLDGQKTFGEN